MRLELQKIKKKTCASEDKMINNICRIQAELLLKNNKTPADWKQLLEMKSLGIVDAFEVSYFKPIRDISLIQESLYEDKITLGSFYQDTIKFVGSVGVGSQGVFGHLKDNFSKVKLGEHSLSLMWGYTKSRIWIVIESRFVKEKSQSGVFRRPHSVTITELTIEELLAKCEPLHIGAVGIFQKLNWEIIEKYKSIEANLDYLARANEQAIFDEMLIAT